MTTPKIAIIGAGPVGCMLARLLTLSNVSVTVYESDASPNYRDQGSTLDLHPKTGLAAIKAAQLWDEYIKLARFDSQYMLMCDQNLKPYVEVGKAGNAISQRPEIDRSQLRRLLMDSLPEGMIKWGHRLQRVDEGNILVFQNTTESGFDLIVGCDGAFSRTRGYVSTDRPLQYSRIGYHNMLIPDAERTAPSVYKMVNRGNVFAHSNGKQFSVQQLADGSINVSMATVRPEDWMKTCGYDDTDLDAAKKALLGEMHDWCPELREVVDKTQGSFSMKNLYMLPPGWHWDHRRGATIIGDAAHVMLPFAGEGVNLGLNDAQKLAEAIIGAVEEGQLDELDSRVEAFEKEMFTRMELFQSQTFEVTKLWLFTEGDLRKIIPKVLASHMRLMLPTFIQPPASALVHAWWFVKEKLSG
ncbi:putative oligopeptide transporter [Xylariaceae sp. FL1651]|nr:putative oligopeptide transporter [Xylariaceae sp. FL1651]